MYHCAVLLVGMLLIWPEPSADDAATAAHDFHVSYGQMAVENNIAVYRVRFFKEDLTEALYHFHQQQEVHLDVSPHTDSLFTQYFNHTFKLEVAGQRLDGVVLGSGEEHMGKQQMWWYSMQFEAPGPLREFTVTNTLLFERFTDQKNIFKVRHFPSEEQKLYYFADGAEEYTISF